MGPSKFYAVAIKIKNKIALLMYSLRFPYICTNIDLLHPKTKPGDDTF